MRSQKPKQHFTVEKIFENCDINENSEEMHYFDQKTTKMAAILLL